MAQDKNFVEVIPDAKRLIHSLRDMGYDFAAAVSDLVDNSIEAGATLVAIDIEFAGDDSWVRIADNGKGMKPADIREAMRYGSEREYTDEDLGKFGLGMKVASLSQCQRMSVASRTSRERAEIAAYCWDLEHIAKSKRWEIVELDRESMGATLRTPLIDTSGTVVLWQRLDRLLGYQYPYGEHARKRLLGMCREAEEYLAMVFHRFLSGEAKGRKKLRIVLNGNEVRAWDPFARSEPETKALSPIPIRIEDGQISGYVVLDPFVLPQQSRFSSPEAFKRTSGLNNWNQQQGFYIYRADRLIQSGGWSRLRTLDEHTKLARVALRFSPQLDDAFKVNVAKMKVQIPQQIREQIEHALKPVIKMAQEAYRRDGARDNAASFASAARNSNTTASRTDATQLATAQVGNAVATSADPIGASLVAAGSHTAINTREGGEPNGSDQATSFQDVIGSLLSVATKFERPIITRVADRLTQRGLKGN